MSECDVRRSTEPADKDQRATNTSCWGSEETGKGVQPIYIRGAILGQLDQLREQEYAVISGVKTSRGKQTPAVGIWKEEKREHSQHI